MGLLLTNNVFYVYLVAQGLPADEQAQESFLDKLRAFRPQQTVIEMTARNTRTLPGKPGSMDSNEVMRRKRAQHQPLIADRIKQKAGPAPIPGLVCAHVHPQNTNTNTQSG